MSGKYKDLVNKYGLHYAKACASMRLYINHASDYRPDELARRLVKLAFTINPETAVITAQQLEIDRLNADDDK